MFENLFENSKAKFIMQNFYKNYPVENISILKNWNTIELYNQSSIFISNLYPVYGPIYSDTRVRC